MAGAVEKIGVAKGDVFSAGGHLLANIGQHDLMLHDTEASVVDRHNGAMSAQVFATPAGLGVTDRHMLSVAGDEVSILVQPGQPGAVGGEESLAVEGDEGMRR